MMCHYLDTKHNHVDSTSFPIFFITRKEFVALNVWARHLTCIRLKQLSMYLINVLLDSDTLRSSIG
jgi:hypothetical protein